MPKQKRVNKLNLHAKSLFLRFNRYTNKGFRPISYYLKFPKISKGFLFASKQYRVYSLNFDFFGSKKYYGKLENSNETLAEHQSKRFPATFEELQKLARFIHVDFVELIFDHIMGSDFNFEINERINECRRLCDEIYPAAKIKLCFKPRFFYDKEALVIIGMLSKRLYSLECGANVLRNAPELKLDFCYTSRPGNMEQLKEILQKHEIKELKLHNLTEIFNCPDLIPQNFFDNFPLNSTLKKFEVGYNRTQDDKNLNQLASLGSLFQFNPNLMVFRLNIKFKEKPENPFTLNQIATMVNEALNQIEELREHIFHHKNASSIEVEIFSSLQINVNTTVKKFNKWAKSIKSHPALKNATHFKPSFNFDPNRIYELDNLESVGHPKHDEYYNFNEDGCYHHVALKWKLEKNFTGLLYLYVVNENRKLWKESI